MLEGYRVWNYRHVMTPFLAPNFPFGSAQVRDVKRVVKAVSLRQGLQLECAGRPWIWSMLKTV